MQFADRVKQTTGTTGTGDYTISPLAVASYATFAATFADGAQLGYCVQSLTDFEVGIGTLSASGTTLSRDTILSSSNSAAAVDWTAGDKDIFCTMPAALVPVYDDSDPTVSDNPPFVGAKRINVITGGEWICTDNTAGANVWRQVGGWSTRVDVESQSGADIVITIPAYVDCFELIFYCKGTSTTSTSIHIGINGDVGKSYDREYYILDGTDAGLQLNNVPSCGRVSSYGLTKVHGKFLVGNLGAYAALNFSRRSGSSTGTSENINLVNSAITDIANIVLHLADSNNDFAAGSFVVCRQITEGS